MLTLRHVPGTHAATINESMPIRGTLWQIVTMIAIIIPHILEPVISQKRLDSVAKLSHIAHNNKIRITGKRRSPNTWYNRSAGTPNNKVIPNIFHIKFFYALDHLFSKRFHFHQNPAYGFLPYFIFYIHNTLTF